MKKLSTSTKMRGAIFALLLAFAMSVSAQVQVRGTVVDELGEPAIGATVQIQGTTQGSITDINGNFTLSAPAGSILLVSYIGYHTQQIDASENIRVVLVPDTEMLDEVIVVAFGTALRSSFTGSASTIQSDAIERAQVSSVTRLLQGAASGVQSMALSGQPGSDASIFIRGIGSINASSQPLFIVDGAPFDGALNSINPADIESISVMKDAASTALYGSRAGNGLVIITTRQGRRNERPTIDARFTYGVSGRAVREYRQVTTDQYFELTWEAIRNQEMFINGATPEEAAQSATNGVVGRLGVNPYGRTAFPNPVGLDGRIVPGAVPLWDDNWTRAYMQNPRRTEASIGISGGSTLSTYFISLSYLDDVGIAPASDFQRYAGRVNLNTDIRPWLRVSTNIALTHSQQLAPPGSDSSTGNALLMAQLIPSFYPVWHRDPDTGELILDRNGDRIPDFGGGTLHGPTGTRPSGAGPNINHLGLAPYNFQKVTRDQAQVRAAMEIDLMKGLTFRTSLNADYNSRSDHNYTNPDVGPASLNPIRGSVTRGHSRTVGLTVNNVFTYQTVLNNMHNIRLLAGQEYYERNVTAMSGRRSGFPSLGFDQPSAASQLDNFSGSADQYKLLSFFGSAEYNFNHRYFGTASIRRDGSSRFSPQSRWGTFWALGGSWRISREEFMQDVEFVDNLSLRASYGGQGNDGLTTLYAYQELFNIQNNLGESGFVTQRLGTPDLRWETNLNFNIGIDYSLFNRRLSGSLEYFVRRSKDLLFDIPQPTSIGFATLPANAGSMKNFGVEASVTGRIVDTRDWRWDLTVNAMHFRNRVTSLPEFHGDGFTQGTKRIQVGGSIHDWFMVEWGGIHPDNGLPQWWMTNDAGERVLTANYSAANTDRSRILTGTSALPDIVGGISSNVTFRNFELSFMFAYALGGQILDNDKSMILNMGANPGRAMSVEMLDRWTPENRYTDVPRLQTSAFTPGWTSTSTRFLVDASYLRLRNMTLGYNLPQSVLTPLHLTACRIFFAGENLFTLFATEGLDPEQNVSGVTHFRYPAMRTASVGISLTF